MKVLGKNVVCLPAKAPTESSGGIHLPESMGREYKCRAFIVSVGPDVKDLEAGNEIIFTKANNNKTVICTSSFKIIITIF